MARKANGQGHTYKVGTSYRTVIKQGDKVVTAMAKTSQLSKSRAKEKLSKLQQSHSEVLADSTVNLGEYLIRWLDENHQHQIAYSTYRRYRSLATHHIIPNLGSQELQTLNSQMITNMLIQMKFNGQSVRSQQQARALLAVALNEAENLNLIKDNPVRKVRNPQGVSKTLTPLNIEEVRKLLTRYEGTYLSARLHIALICGLRQGEALGLRWNDIDFESSTLSVSGQIQSIHGVSQFTRLKTNRSYRTLVLTKETLDTLKIHRAIIKSWEDENISTWKNLDLVFPRVDGSPKSSHSDYAEWQKALKVCEITPHRLHDARHTAATLMYSTGIGIEIISRTLGHSSSAITSRTYVHSSRAPLEIAAMKMNELIKSDQ